MISGEFLSEPDLTTADRSAWDSGFPPGFTVDELRFHRRRRPPADTPLNNQLGPDGGDFKNVKSEYKRRFRNYYDASTRETFHYELKDLSPSRSSRPDDNPFFDSELHEFRPEYHESFIEFRMDEPQRRPARRLKRNRSHFLDHLMNNQQGEQSSYRGKQSEKQSQFVKYENTERVLPIRRSTSLKLEGDLSVSTEQAEQFIEYLLARRRSLIKHPSNLHLEGEMHHKTETDEQFAPYALNEYTMRPPLYKQLTHLRLEGDMDTTTENTDQYVPYELEMRPPLVKRHTNLRLEGELQLDPEYRHEFVEFKSERSSPSLPRHNLRIDGFFDSLTENQSKYVDHHAHPPIPFLRSSDFNRKLLIGDDKAPKNAEYKDKYIPHNAIEKSKSLRRNENLSLEGEFDTMTENRHAFVEKNARRAEIVRATPNLQLEGNFDMNPEYKNAYVDFYKTSNYRSESPRSRIELSSSALRSDGAMENHPEYKRSFVDFPRQRPTVRKPETHLSSEGEMNHVTEKRAQYIEYPYSERPAAMKREPEFKLEGEFVCQPEYRRAYVDYLIRERIERKSRPLDNFIGGGGGTSAVQKRAFDILTPAATAATQNDANNNSLPVAKPITKSAIPIAMKKPPTPSTTAPSATVIEDAKSQSRIPRRRTSISKLETQLFGPKIEMPRRSSSSSRLPRATAVSRSPSPRNRARNRSLGRSNTKYSSADSHYLYNKSARPHRDRTGEMFTKSVRVEDLAYTPITSPIPTHTLYSLPSPKKWNRALPAANVNEQVDRLAFVVLEDDINNNLEGFNNRNPLKSLYKEQKWMQSWSSPTL